MLERHLERGLVVFLFSSSVAFFSVNYRENRGRSTRVKAHSAGKPELVYCLPEHQDCIPATTAGARPLAPQNSAECPLTPAVKTYYGRHVEDAIPPAVEGVLSPSRPVDQDTRTRSSDVSRWRSYGAVSPLGATNLLWVPFYAGADFPSYHSAAFSMRCVRTRPSLHSRRSLPSSSALQQRPLVSSRTSRHCCSL